MHAAYVVPTGRHHMWAHRLRLPGKQSLASKTQQHSEPQEGNAHTSGIKSVYIFRIKLYQIKNRAEGDSTKQSKHIFSHTFSSLTLKTTV